MLRRSLHPPRHGPSSLRNSTARFNDLSRTRLSSGRSPRTASLAPPTARVVVVRVLLGPFCLKTTTLPSSAHLNGRACSRRPPAGALGQTERAGRGSSPPSSPSPRPRHRPRTRRRAHRPSKPPRTTWVSRDPPFRRPPGAVELVEGRTGAQTLGSPCGAGSRGVAAVTARARATPPWVSVPSQTAAKAPDEPPNSGATDKPGRPVPWS
jgi:hypothetical protein